MKERALPVIRRRVKMDFPSMITDFRQNVFETVARRLNFTSAAKKLKRGNLKKSIRAIWNSAAPSTLLQDTGTKLKSTSYLSNHAGIIITKPN